MKRMLVWVVLLGLLGGCGGAKVLKYGYLPGGDYPFYEPEDWIDLKDKAFSFQVEDKRDQFKTIAISMLHTTDDSELAGQFGRDYFAKYLKGLTEYCRGQVLDVAPEAYTIDLEVLCPKMEGVGYIRVHGMVQFTVRSATFSKRYSVDLKDGDPGAPLGKFSLSTRRGAMRKMVAAAARDAIQSFLQDISGRQ